MHAVVVGGGVGGLVAAFSLLRRGDEVVVLEAGGSVGGRVAPVDVDGIEFDGGAESFAVRGGTVAALLADVGLGDDVADPVGSAWVALGDRTVPLPAGGVLGIPGVPIASDVVRVLGTAGAVRAYLDRLVPVVKIGRYERLGPLVRSRMGTRVLTRLVDPVVRNVYGVDPEDAPVDVIAPALNAAITATGSLSAAVLRLRSAAPAGAAAQGIAGGVHRLPTALSTVLQRRGTEVRLGVAATALERDASGWIVRTGAAAPVRADRVVLALDGAGALDLLAPLVPGVAALPRPVPTTSRTVLLVVDDARLDGAPRGTGVLRAAERTDVLATALTHSSAKWPWLAARLPPHRHALRLAYRGPDPVDDARVRADASALLGLDLAAHRARTDVVWTDSAPALDPAVLAARRLLTAAALPAGLGVTGAWVAGTGLAAVVAHALRTGRHIAT